jgi:hypothetical protein
VSDNAQRNTNMARSFDGHSRCCWRALLGALACLIGLGLARAALDQDGTARAI